MAIAASVVVMLLVTALAACGGSRPLAAPVLAPDGSTQPSASVATIASARPSGSAVASTAPTGAPTSAGPWGAPSSGAPASTHAPKASPVPTPDLGALDQLLDQLDAALAADAAAEADEGSPR